MVKHLDTFVLMPSGSHGEYEGGPTESDYVFHEIIEPGVSEAICRLNAPDGDTATEARIMREVDRSHSGSITSGIIQSLASADVVIVDITGRNANVFLELGIRYALRSKVTILMAQRGTQIPFDINVYRYIDYDRFKPREARVRIAEAIRAGTSTRLRSDSIVFDVLPSMSVSIPGIANSFGVEARPPSDVMSWDEYMSHIHATCNYVDLAFRGDTHYHPAAILGISNGGGIAADLIGKKIFSVVDTPVLVLWARRHEVGGESAFWYFDNPFNDAMIQGIKLHGKRKDGCLEILLIDDHMGTGTTARQAIAYLQDRIGDEVRITFIPIVSARRDSIGVVEEFLPYQRTDARGKRIFEITKDQLVEQLDTNALYFPYLQKQVNH